MILKLNTLYADLTILAGDLIGSVDEIGENLYNDLGELYWIYIAVFAVGVLLYLAAQKALGKTLMVIAVVAFVLFNLTPTIFEYLQQIIGIF